MSAPENPRAFPNEEFGQCGMTLRDYFAGQALAGLCALAADDPARPVGWPCMALASYNCADAMLAERAKGGDA